MDESDEELARELRNLLPRSGYRTAFGDEPSEGDRLDEAADEGDGFFAAMSAFRAARQSGDKDAEADAEARLREAVRSELMGQ